MLRRHRPPAHVPGRCHFLLRGDADLSTNQSGFLQRQFATKAAGRALTVFFAGWFFDRIEKRCGVFLNYCFLLRLRRERRLEQMPGFAVLLIRTPWLRMRFWGQQNTGVVCDDVNRNDEPRLVGNDMHNDKVDLTYVVRNGAIVVDMMCVDDKLFAHPCAGGFYLDTQELTTIVEDPIIGVILAIRLGHREPSLCREQAKRDFRDVAAMFLARVRRVVDREGEPRYIRRLTIHLRWPEKRRQPCGGRL